VPDHSVVPGVKIASFAPAFDTLVAEAMGEWKIPGLAISVVQNGEVALLRAYGHRDVEAGLPVTTDTQFTICSITKSFTSTGLAQLVDERLLDWSKPVRDYVPEFRLNDPVATDRISVRDLLCHHSSLLEILTYFIIDRLCGKEPVPWFDRFRQRRRKFLAQQDTDRQANKAVRRTGTRPSHDLVEYTGEYEHPGYGRIAIAQDGSGLHWGYRGLSAPLTHRHYDTFELPEVSDHFFPDQLAISFITDREGNITSLSAPFEPMVKDIVFIRLAAGD
jgi:Beta-lactamase/Domain of unknown function (DUF3471)